VDFSLIENWFEDMPFEAVRGMESSPDVRERAQQFLQWLRARPERCVVVVCHGLFIHALFGANGGLQSMFHVAPRDAAAVAVEGHPKNCALHEVVIGF
jgi:broad specificity phosphatase PhoE